LVRSLLAAAVLFALGFGGTVPASGGTHEARSTHRFEDPERWARIFDDPKRDSWQKPEEVVEFLGVKEGAVVADLGAGTGYFTVRLARAVGSTGKVYAVDIEPSLVRYLAERARKENLPQVVPVLAEPDDPKLPDRSVGLVLVCDTWHHIGDRVRYLGRLRRALAPGGKVAIVDFREGELPVGPPPKEKLTRKEILAEFAEAGWTLAGEYGGLPYQYVLVFAPPARETGRPAVTPRRALRRRSPLRRSTGARPSRPPGRGLP
jgi:SAM-dependent methyltransferase